MLTCYQSYRVIRQSTRYRTEDIISEEDSLEKALEIAKVNYRVSRQYFEEYRYLIQCWDNYYNEIGDLIDCDFHCFCWDSNTIPPWEEIK